MPLDRAASAAPIWHIRHYAGIRHTRHHVTYSFGSDHS